MYVLHRLKASSVIVRTTPVCTHAFYATLFHFDGYHSTQLHQKFAADRPTESFPHVASLERCLVDLAIAALALTRNIKLAASCRCC